MNDFYLVLSYFVVWAIILFLPSYIVNKLPQSNFFEPTNFLFKERVWEKKGKIYEKIFRIKRWKGFLPDGAKVFKDGFEKKHLKTYSLEYLETFVYESCKAEFAHIIPIFLSLIFLTYNPPKIFLIMFLFGIVINLPCIITQRYNRIRMTRLINKIKKQVQG